MNHLTSLLIVVFSMLTQTAYSQEVTWETIRVKSGGRPMGCQSDSITTVYNGNSASIIFSSLGVNLAPNIDHQPGAQFGTCQVRSRLTVPKGFYISGISQSTIAGVIKTQRASGFITSRLLLQSKEIAPDVALPAFPGLGPMGEAINKTVRFASKDVMNAPMLVLDGQFTTPDFGKKHICRYSNKNPVILDMVFKTEILGQRILNGQVLISVDSNDVQLNLGVNLEKCS